MSKYNGRVKKLKREVELVVANYRVQKIVENCENCKYMREFNHTCSKNRIRVNSKYGLCDHFEDGSYFYSKLAKTREEKNNG